jgi:hypothetical protein
MTSGMPYVDFLNAIIDDGQDEVRTEYLRPDQSMKREGALDGFEACRAQQTDQLLTIHRYATERTQWARVERRADYWYWRLYEAQVEWVLNVISAALYANGGTPLIQPTARGLNKAIQILGTETNGSTRRLS